MGEVGAKTLLRAQAPTEWLEGPEWDLLFRAAASAYEVAVPHDVGAVPARDAVVEMRVRDVTEILERFEVSVNGRRIDLRVAGPDLARDLLGGRVMARALERIEDETALDRHSPALRADLVGHAHAPTLRQSQASCKSRYREDLR
jgi:hypothetical protein